MRTLKWVRPRHFLLLGLALGLLLAWLHLITRAPLPRAMSQEAFEGNVHRWPEQGHPPLTDLVVRPPHRGVQVVTGRRLIFLWLPPVRLQYVPFSFSAPFPYHPGGEEPPRPDFSVRDYLDAVAKEGGRQFITYRYDRWASPEASFALWAGGSVAVIGLIWPLLLTLFSKGDKPSPRMVEAVPSRGDARLADDAEMEAALLAAAASDEQDAPTAEPTAPLPAAPARLSSDRRETSPPAPAKEERRFDGQFYPTAAHSPRPDHE